MCVCEVHTCCHLTAMYTWMGGYVYVCMYVYVYMRYIHAVI